MKRIIFYSWQNDLPNSTNRGQIGTALKNVVKEISNDDSIEVEPVLDRDTQGVSGSPDISSTIFAKITACDVFVADVSIIGECPKRFVPNPNVLIEVGYAIRCINFERIVLVFNTAFGKIEDLPFDLRSRRVMTYHLPEGAEEKATVRRALETQLNVAIRNALSHITNQQVAPAIPAVEAIENVRPNRVVVLRRNLETILTKLDEIQPTRYGAGGTTEELIDAIDRTQESVAEFSKICEVIAITDDETCAREIYTLFSKILQRYELPSDSSGRVSNADCDYFKFLGHEMFLTHISFLLNEKRWEALKSILSLPLIVESSSRYDSATKHDWRELSEFLPSFSDYSRQHQRLSLHSDLLHSRHTTGGLSSIVPLTYITSADLLLFFICELKKDDSDSWYSRWRSWSLLYMKGTPEFILQAESKTYATELARLIDLDITTMKQRMLQRYGKSMNIFGTWENSRIDVKDINDIATR